MAGGRKFRRMFELRRANPDTSRWISKCRGGRCCDGQLGWFGLIIMIIIIIACKSKRITKVTKTCRLIGAATLGAGSFLVKKFDSWAARASLTLSDASRRLVSNFQWKTSTWSLSEDHQIRGKTKRSNLRSDEPNGVRIEFYLHCIKLFKHSVR